MRSIATVSFAIIVVAALSAPAAFADGEGCSASEKREAEGALRKAEEAEKAGKYKDAYKFATSSFGEPGCATNGYKRREGLVERTSKKLGAEAEKAGRFGEAFKYYYAPYSYRTTYSLADADRAMLKHVKANPDDYKAASQAVDYFKGREGTPHLQEVRASAKRAGDRMLAKEEKTFAARKDSLADLQKAKEWLELAGEGKRANTRAVQRGDTLLAEGGIRSMELAFQYYDFARDKQKLESAKSRARKLGDDAAAKGDHGLAAKFYELSGDKSRVKAAEKQKEKTETQRQDQFKKDQKSLEKELGL
jgi:hypothetical protein